MLTKREEVVISLKVAESDVSKMENNNWVLLHLTSYNPWRLTWSKMFFGPWNVCVKILSGLQNLRNTEYESSGVPAATSFHFQCQWL